MVSAKSSRSAELAAHFQALMGVVNGRGAGESLRLMHESGLTFPQIISLYALRALGPQTVSALAKHVNLTKGAASQLIDRMVTAGIVTRDEGDDRRVRLIALTPRGRALLERLHGARNREWQAALGQLPPPLQDRLLAVMVDVADALAKASAKPMRPTQPGRTRDLRDPGNLA